MPDITVPAAPALATIPGVELVQSGQWEISTGRIVITPDDLASAVGALDCPAIRRPPIKLGHHEPLPEGGMRWDGEPAVGWIDNMALADSGHTLVGDYVGMPAWLAEILPSAYPDRSFEGVFDFTCQVGHTHPFVITAMALLGVVEPGIGTLRSLQDVASLYGVAAADSTDPRGEPVTLLIKASRGDSAMPNPRPMQVAAAVSSEDVRRAYYESAPWEVWICEMQLDPLQLITTNDQTGEYARVPIVLDGDEVAFGAPVPVRIEYVDITDTDAPAGDAGVPVAASAGRLQRIVYASRAESRPGPAAEGVLPSGVTLVHNASGQPEPVLTADQQPPASADAQAASSVQNPPPAPADGSITTQEGEPVDKALLRQALGLSPEASDDDVKNKLAENGMTPDGGLDLANAEVIDETGEDDAPDSPDDGDATTTGPAQDDPPSAPPEPVQAAALPPGTVAIDETTLADLRAKAEQGVAARAQQRREERNRVLDAAVKAGKFPPARREYWENYWKQDEEGAKQALASLAPGLVPVADIGEPGSERDLRTSADDDYDRLFPKGA
ncbi:hypothetical protein ACFVH6_21930 [Spirillospora sp. NPDC127200]